MAIKPAINQFNGGEISPWLEGRFDWDKYNYSAKLCQNFIPLIEGSLRRRNGSHFVAEAEELPIIDIKFAITFSDNPAVLPNTYISLDGGAEEKLNSFFSPIPYQLNLNYGAVLKYTIRAYGYEPVEGEIAATEDEIINIELLSITNAVTLTINPEPDIADVYINGIKTRSLTFDKSRSVTYKVAFGKDIKTDTIKIEEDTTLNIVLNKIILDAAEPTNAYITFQKGFYKVIVIGAGGGAGGGSWGDDRKSTGGGGGSGAGFIGVIEIEGTYQISCGNKGYGANAGRKAGYEGQKGSSSYIGRIIVAGGGNGGKPRLPIGDGGTGERGIGGSIEVNIVPAKTELQKNGNGGDGRVNQGAASVYKNYGKGGDGVYKGAGTSGSNGYLYIEYVGSTFNG